MRRQLGDFFIANPPQVFIGIDAPDFNFSLEKRLKKNGICTIHYVSPSIWAWRKGRMAKIKRAVNHMLTLFPFEPAIYEAAGVKATFVGHPLADEIPLHPDVQEARDLLKLAKAPLVIAMLPGSRVGEVKQLAEFYVEAAKRVSMVQPEALFLVPLITRETRNIFEKVLYASINQANEKHHPSFKILFGHAHTAMQASDLVVVASGTATLEAALLKRPMVITYRMPWFSWQILKRLNYLPYVGLPNILAQRFVVPELLQDDANPTKLAEAILNMVNDKAILDDIRGEFCNDIREYARILESLATDHDQYIMETRDYYFWFNPLRRYNQIQFANSDEKIRFLEYHIRLRNRKLPKRLRKYMNDPTNYITMLQSTLFRLL
jgi:lipid-A-disaccharide synthase